MPVPQALAQGQRISSTFGDIPMSFLKKRGKNLTVMPDPSDCVHFTHRLLSNKWIMEPDDTTTRLQHLKFCGNVDLNKHETNMGHGTIPRSNLQ